MRALTTTSIDITGNRYYNMSFLTWSCCPMNLKASMLKLKWFWWFGEWICVVASTSHLSKTKTARATLPLLFHALILSYSLRLFYSIWGHWHWECRVICNSVHSKVTSVKGQRKKDTSVSKMWSNNFNINTESPCICQLLGWKHTILCKGIIE